MMRLGRIRRFRRRSGRRARVLGGQASVEFIVVMPVFLLVVLLIFGAGFSFFERSVAIQRLSSLGRELPSDWELLSDEELVKTLLCNDGILDPSKVSVTSASVAFPSPTKKVMDPDDVAQSLGKNRSSVETGTLEVKADVSYTYRDLLSLGGSASMTGHVERTYLIGQKYEIT